MKHFHLTILALFLSFSSFALVGPITGASPMCPGTTAPLGDTTAGGVWSSSDTTIVSINATTGLATAVAAGTATITYTVGAASVTATIIVNPSPTVYTLYFAGSGVVCGGTAGLNLYLSGSSIGAEYTLYTGTPPAATLTLSGTGSIIDFGAWTMPVSYSAIATNISTGCSTYMLGSPTLTILPAIGPIVGPAGVCVGSSVTLTDTTTGGRWSSSNPALATIGSASGVLTGIAVGVDTVTYTSAYGCTKTYPVTVINTVLPITGPTNACIGATTTLSDSSAGGTWVSGSPATATINAATGLVTGVSTGSSIITYTVGGSCGAVYATVAVHAAPGAILGATSVCEGAGATLYDGTPGGAWTSADLSVATIDISSGAVTGLSSGTSVITYTATDGCIATSVMTVDERPVLAGPSSVCIGSSVVLTTSIGGSWTSSNTAVATVSAGIVTGITPGTATMNCAAYSTGCLATHVVTVTSSCTGTPVVGAAVAGSSLVCPGNTVMLSLSGFTSVCGVLLQWESSTDSASWANITGATTASVYITPAVSMYYRCKATCYSSGLSAYSTLTYVAVHNSISSHAVVNTPSYFCNGPDFQMTTCGYGASYNVTTWYGDGTSDNNTSYNDIYHTYSAPGTYLVKQVLYNGFSPVDSITFSYNYYYCRTLPVVFYFDANSDCIFDGGDQYNYTPVTTRVDSNGIPIDTIVATSGFYYSAKGDSGTVYSFRVLSTAAGLHLTCPVGDILSDTIQSYMNTYTPKFFGLNCTTSSSFDLGITADMNCGRHFASGMIYVDNAYCTPESSVVTMNFSPNYTFGSSVPAPYSVVGNTVTWHIPPMSVYTNPVYISYYLTVSGPWLTTGDTINSSYTITPYAGDADTTNNYFTRTDTVRASYDPNYLAVSPGGFVIPCTPLRYSVDFQNTGNDTAHNVTVLDTLSDNVDPNSIQVVFATSVMNMAVVPFGVHNVVKFDFPGINLPDSSHHNLCNGGIVFTVNARNGLADGTTIFNHAGIIFDDNKPILTDTVENIIGISPITGPTTLCNASSILLADASVNGTWSSSSPTAIVAGGVVTGVAAGTDVISYTVTNACATRTAIQVVNITPNLVPGVSISSGTGSDTICVGTIPTFTAHTVNGGTSPAYQWIVNGVPAAIGGTDTAYTYVPASGDTLSVKLTSNAVCPLPDTAISNIVITVLTPVEPTLSLVANPGLNISPGQTDTFTAIISGPVPSLQWYVNGVAVPGDTSSVFFSSSLNNGDSVSCVATSRDFCKLATFNSFIIAVSTEGIRNLAANGNISIYPNPNKGIFTIKGSAGFTNNEEVSVQITDMLGQVVYKGVLIARNGIVNAQIDLSKKSIAGGMYMLNLRSDKEDQVLHFVIAQ